MTQQYQYQAVVEPVFVPPYDASGLEWHPRDRQVKHPPWTKARQELSQVIFAELELPQVGWIPHESRTVPRLPIPIRDSVILALQPPIVDIGWLPSAWEPVFKKTPARGLGRSQVTDYLEPIPVVVYDPATMEWIPTGGRIVPRPGLPGKTLISFVQIVALADIGWLPHESRRVPRPGLPGQAPLAFVQTVPLPEIGWLPHESRFVTRVYVTPPQNRGNVSFVNYQPVIVAPATSTQEDVLYRRMQAVDDTQPVYLRYPRGDDDEG